ncbi:MAG: phosphate ABC transporter permease PstA [Spirochaetaceae bacterium]|jgi:phosphate transport system permease protein|nr:phosphate ABC transporter permease PstA [Spirochaetaceae bacterium]
MKNAAPLKQKRLSLFLRFLASASAAMTMFIILFLAGYILAKGIPHISPGLFAWEYTSENVSLTPAFLNTLIVTAAALLIAVPAGVFAAIWLAEYARKGSRLVSAAALAAETLAGVPSIIYGLFGMLLFVIALGWGYSLLACTLTLAIMILPLIMRTTEEALRAVPDGYREGSFGLGAGKLRTVFAVVLPSAMPGILAGIILATGRIVGETAALIFTAGTVAKLPRGPFSSVRTLAVHMYSLASEGLYINQAYAAAVFLLILVAGINGLSAFAAKKAAEKLLGETGRGSRS